MGELRLQGLLITTTGEPIKISACWQKRTGSAFRAAVFFDLSQTAPAGLFH